MLWVHKSLSLRADVWKKLRLDAEQSGFPLRDYVTYLIDTAGPVTPKDEERYRRLRDIAATNIQLRRVQCRGQE